MTTQNTAEMSSPPEPDGFAKVAAYTIAHMNEDHRQNLLDYARALAGLAWAEAAEMKAVDPAGFELLVQGGERTETVRITFDVPVTRADMLRPNLVKMAKESRQLLAERQHTQKL